MADRTSGVLSCCDEENHWDAILEERMKDDDYFVRQGAEYSFTWSLASMVDHQLARILQGFGDEYSLGDRINWQLVPRDFKVKTQYNLRKRCHDNARVRCNICGLGYTEIKFN